MSAEPSQRCTCRIVYYSHPPVCPRHGTIGKAMNPCPPECFRPGGHMHDALKKKRGERETL